MTRDPQQHLTEDEFRDFVLEELPEDLEQQLDEHLEWCEECTRQLESYYMAEDEFPAGEWASRRDAFLSALQDRVFAPPLWDRLRNLLLPFPLVLRPAFKTPALADGQTEDGTLRWRFVEDEAGNLTLRFGSHALELEGVCLRLTAGPWRRDVVLEREASDQVGAATVLTREERAALPVEVELRIDHAAPPAGSSTR